MLDNRLWLLEVGGGEILPHTRYDIDTMLTIHRGTNSCAIRTSGPIFAGPKRNTRLFVDIYRYMKKPPSSKRLTPKA